MIRLLLFIFIFLYSCNKQDEVNPMQYGDTGLDEHYFINLDWNNNLSTSKTAVNIKWNQWIQNDSTEFIKYSIKDVTTENVKLIEEINSFSDTSYSVEFPTGTYLRLCVIAKSAHNQLGTVYYQSSDSILFFTEPLSSVSNIDIDSNPDEHIITWKPSPDENIDNLMIYRSKIDEDSESIPSLNINLSSGSPDDQWEIIYEGTNQDTIFTALDIFSTYKYFYCINVQVENQNDDTEYIQNYRYSLIKPATSQMTDPIENHIFNLNASKDFTNYIQISWDEYSYNDFYKYEIWKSDDAIEYSKIIEISNYDYNYFEDNNNVGSGKSWWYKIKVYNHFGNSLESEIVEGYTRP